MKSQDSNPNIFDKQWSNESFDTCWTIFEPKRPAIRAVFLKCTKIWSGRQVYLQGSFY